jgi:hypothetical protein
MRNKRATRTVKNMTGSVGLIEWFLLHPTCSPHPPSVIEGFYLAFEEVIPQSEVLRLSIDSGQTASHQFPVDAPPVFQKNISD